MTGKTIATPVLVHGAWHGAWCWERAAVALAADGINAVAIDLPGHGNDPGPMGDLHGDAAHAAAVLDALGGPVVLAGHAYGGAVTLDPDVARACFYQDCDPGTAAWAVARLASQPLASLQQQPYAVAWRTKPSTYVVCASDQAIHPGLQRILSRRCLTAEEWPTGHAPFLARPDLVAGLLAGLVGTGCAR
jgi:pimeloyl-ACP methyl ester carboxylesterase